ncbi:MAG: transcriptional regulator [Planctomycetota bacterium]|nr:MAG: transcriptional regulator [Planctomycetota bacterium]
MSRVIAEASVFHAIADPTRRAILDLLRDGEQAVSSLLESFRFTQSALSQHLAVLRNAGLVLVRKAGRQRFYRLRARPLREVSEWVAYYDKFWNERLDNLGKYLEKAHGPRRRQGS